MFPFFCALHVLMYMVYIAGDCRVVARVEGEVRGASRRSDHGRRASLCRRQRTPLHIGALPAGQGTLRLALDFSRYTLC